MHLCCWYVVYVVRVEHVLLFIHLIQKDYCNDRSRDEILPRLRICGEDVVKPEKVSLKA
jgi:hypothetical protein